MTDSNHNYEQDGTQVLLWAMWGGLGFATVGEVVLFMALGSSGASGGSLPPAQLVVVGFFTSIMLGLAALVRTREIGGGGFPTALICWILLKSIAITGLVVYKLSGLHLYYWPFLAVFVLGMTWLNPTRFLNE